VVTPNPDHLGELVGALDLIRVDPDKPDRLALTLGDGFDLRRSDEYADELALPRADLARLVAMGPSAWHQDPVRLAERLARLPEPYPVTLSVRLGVYRRR